MVCCLRQLHVGGPILWGARSAYKRFVKRNLGVRADSFRPRKSNQPGTHRKGSFDGGSCIPVPLATLSSKKCRKERLISAVLFLLLVQMQLMNLR